MRWFLVGSVLYSLAYLAASLAGLRWAHSVPVIMFTFVVSVWTLLAAIKHGRNHWKNIRCR